MTAGLITLSSYFNPRSHERSDFFLQCLCDCCQLFQSTLPREERQSWRTHSLKGVNFNPRSHERSDDTTAFIPGNSVLFQSTLPREERLFLHLPLLPVLRFQSTLPREERRNLCGNPVNFSLISIHAPTRGATFFAVFPCFGIYYFNPRSHERSDLRADCVRIIYIYFNPRSHERSDHIRLFLHRTALISIHAPTRGATFQADLIRSFSFISIHAPTRGATNISLRSLTLIIISIHAPTRGATAILHKKFVYFYTIPTINI